MSRICPNCKNNSLMKCIIAESRKHDFGTDSCWACVVCNLALPLDFFDTLKKVIYKKENCSICGGTGKAEGNTDFKELTTKESQNG